MYGVHFVNWYQKKKVRQLTNRKLNSQKVQHLRRCGLAITKPEIPTEGKKVTLEIEG